MARDDYLPPDLDAKAASARRRQKLAETMLAQSLQPRQGRMAGRIYVAPSPLEGIAQVAQAWAANRAGERADTEIGDIAKEGRQRTIDEIARIRTIREGMPGTPTPMGEDPMGGAVDPMPTGAVRPDPKRAVEEALFSPDPRVAKAGEVMFEGDQRRQLASDLAQLRAGAEAGDPSSVREWKYFQSLPDDATRQQFLILKRATSPMNLGGSMMIPNPLAPGGEPLANIPKTLEPGDVPEVRGAQAAAAATGKGVAEAQVARVEAARGGTELLDEAEAILGGSMGENPTGSGLGTLVDTAGRFVGQTPEGARAAARLETIGSQLTLRTPRMQGPQSDKDRQLYEEAAGKVGDRTKTVAERIESLKVARSIIEKYDPETGMPRGAAAGAATVSAPGMSLQERLDKYR